MLNHIRHKKYLLFVIMGISIIACGLIFLPFSASVAFPYPNTTLQVCSELGRLVYKNVHDGSSSASIKSCLSTPDEVSVVANWCIAKGWPISYSRDYTYCTLYKQEVIIGKYAIRFGQSANLVGYTGETKIFLWTTVAILPIE